MAQRPGDVGGAYNVQGTAPGKQSAGGIAGLFGAETDKAQGPNADAYNQERLQASNNANAYGDLGQNYTQTGPTIANQYQTQSRGDIGNNVGLQRNLADTLLQNNGEASRDQFQGNLDQSIAAQMAAANSTSGGAVAQAGATRAAGERGALMLAQGSATSAQLGAQEREAALGQAAGVYNNIGGQLQSQYGLEQGSAVSQAGLDSQNQAQQDSMRLGYAGLGNQAQGQSLNALNSYTGANQSAQGLSLGLQNASAAATNQAIGTGAGIVGTMFGGPAGGAVASGAAGAATGGTPVPPHAAYGGAIGPAPNSIAAIYGAHVPAQAPAPRVATLADALAGIDALKARLSGVERGR